MPKATKRERQRQNREARRAAMQEAEKRRRRNRTMRNMAIATVLVVGVAALLSVLGSDDKKDTSSNATKRTFAHAPAQTIDPTATYTATIDTSEGTIVVALDAAQFPTSVNNFVFLARHHFYDGLRFNRVAKDFVIQTGSPSNTQSGGPGYTVRGEVPSTTPAYPVGAVAFAKAGTEPAGTAGSQFFIVTGSSNPDLPADYAGIGTVSEGLDVAQKIGQLYPASGDGPPTEKVTIRKLTVSETPGSATTTVAPTTAAP